VFISDVPGVEVVVDGIDPRALVLLEPASSPDEPPAELATDDVARAEAARLFVYQRNLERIAGTVEALTQELAALLERELEAFVSGAPLSERVAPASEPPR
jgi:hypothetical protein